MKAYIALTIIGNESGTKRWMPGAVIEMSDERALPLLQNGHVMAHPENLEPPELPAPITAVIEAGKSAALADEDGDLSAVGA